MLENNQDLDQFEGENEGPTKEERVLGAISYGPFGFLLPLFMDKKSPFVAFHTKQGGIIFGTYFVSTLIFRFFIFFGVFTMLYIGLAVYGAMKAYNGEMFEFTIIKKIKDKLNGK
ncbi:MAG: hypothetical protein PHS92_04750 [Candidatus Gracilibacteria bacterium]|nr:hypothetical protein [Candidatus Gracilibacteria bacterium]